MSRPCAKKITWTYTNGPTWSRRLAKSFRSIHFQYCQFVELPDSLSRGILSLDFPFRGVWLSKRVFIQPWRIFFCVRTRNFFPKTHLLLCNPTKLRSEISSEKHFCLFLVMLVCGGSWFNNLCDHPILNSLIRFILPFIDNLSSPMEIFNSFLPQFPKTPSPS